MSKIVFKFDGDKEVEYSEKMKDFFLSAAFKELDLGDPVPISNEFTQDDVDRVIQFYDKYYNYDESKEFEKAFYKEERLTSCDLTTNIGEKNIQYLTEFYSKDSSKDFDLGENCDYDKLRKGLWIAFEYFHLKQLEVIFSKMIATFFKYEDTEEGINKHKQRFPEFAELLSKDKKLSWEEEEQIMEDFPEMYKYYYEQSLTETYGNDEETKKQIRQLEEQSRQARKEYKASKEQQDEEDRLEKERIAKEEASDISSGEDIPSSK